MRRLRYLSDDLPFDFNCGFVGYFGYELKADCEGDAAAPAPRMPDAAFIFADRLIAFDHSRSAPTCSASTDPTSEDEEAERWIAETSRAPRLAAAADEPSGAQAATGRGAGRVPPEPLAPAVPRRHRSECKRPPDRGRDLRGLPDQQGRAPRSAPIRCRSTARCAASTRRRSRPSCASARPRCSAPRRSASCASAATAGSRRSRSRAPAAAARTAPRTCAWPRSCAPTRRTAPRT